MEVLLAGAAIWAVCGALAYGLTLAYFQMKYPAIAYPWRHADTLVALLVAVFGPFGLIVTLLSSEGCRYGLRYKPLSDKESWAAFQKKYPGLSKEDWLR